MSEFKVLDAMGVHNPEEIARYELYSVEGTDVLRITYDRKKGSILPVTKKYRFPMVKKSTMVDSGTRETRVLYESSGELQNAVAELGRLLDKKSSKVEAKKVLEEEIRLLEEDFAGRIASLKSLVEKL